MEIVLKKEWMGHPAGTELDIVGNVAQRLIQWGTAESSKPPGSPSKKKLKEN